MYQESGAAMTVDFYTVTDDARVVNKTLPAASKHTITTVDIFKPSDLIHPRLVLGSFTDMFQKNYCYVTKFGYYYFIDDITVTSAQRVIMDLTLDPFYSLKDSIVNCTGTAVRSESAGINTVSDSKFPLSSCEYTLECLNYDRTPFTRNPSSPYILTTIGGGDD